MTVTVTPSLGRRVTLAGDWDRDGDIGSDGPALGPGPKESGCALGRGLRDLNLIMIETYRAVTQAQAHAMPAAPDPGRQHVTFKLNLPVTRKPAGRTPAAAGGPAAPRRVRVTPSRLAPHSVAALRVRLSAGPRAAAGHMIQIDPADLPASQSLAGGGSGSPVRASLRLERLTLTQ